MTDENSTLSAADQIRVLGDELLAVARLEGVNLDSAMGAYLYKMRYAFWQSAGEMDEREAMLQSTLEEGIGTLRAEVAKLRAARANTGLEVREILDGVVDQVGDRVGELLSDRITAVRNGYRLFSWVAIGIILLAVTGAGVLAGQVSFLRDRVAACLAGQVADLRTGETYCPLRTLVPPA